MTNKKSKGNSNRKDLDRGGAGFGGWPTHRDGAAMNGAPDWVAAKQKAPLAAPDLCSLISVL
jgi:hypothetical protein